MSFCGVEIAVGYSHQLLGGGSVAGVGRDADARALRDWDGLALKEQTPSGTTVTPVAQDAVPELLSNRFGLPGYAVSAEGRLVPAAPA
jgi:hypothetical protein